jgi:hypothetical protein
MKTVICTPIEFVIHNFLDASRINDHENVIYFIAPSQYFHHLGLFIDNHLEELNFPTLFYGNP